MYDAVDMRADMEEGYDLQLAGRKASSAAAAGEADSSSSANEDDDDDEDDDEGDDVSSQDSIHHRLAAMFDQALDRLEAVGRDSFFGWDPAKALPSRPHMPADIAPLS